MQQAFVVLIYISDDTHLLQHLHVGSPQVLHIP